MRVVHVLAKLQFTERQNAGKRKGHNMKHVKRIISVGICLVMMLGMFAGLTPARAGDNELPIIPITPPDPCKNGHDWGEPGYEWSDDLSQVTATRVCKRNSKHTETETVETTSKVTKPAGCTTPGETTYTASFKNEAFQTQSKTVENIDAPGHTPGEAVRENEAASTCTVAGSYDAVIYCTACNTELSRESQTLPLADHDYVAAVTPPTCLEQGYTTHTCSVCGASYTDAYVDAPGHTPGEAVRENEAASTCTVAGSYDAVIYCTACNTELSRESQTLPLADHDYVAAVTPPTCLEQGYTTHTCSVCGASYTDAYVDAPGHTPGEAVREHEIAPTCTAQGSYDTVVYCTVCGAEISRETVTVDAGHSYVDGVCTVCGEADPDYKPDDPRPIDNPFEDVGEDDWFRAAVLWAVEQNITSGVDATHFAPGNKCTRAEIVTFVWNAAGRPDAGSVQNPFVDVKESDWYNKAVLWAVANGITSGVDATHFSPAKQCTRAEVVQFLWNAAGNPNPNLEGRVQIPFTDVNASDWFCSAVQWAISNRITSGTTPTTFAPYKSCTRAEVVQFLYKAS